MPFACTPFCAIVYGGGLSCLVSIVVYPAMGRFRGRSGMATVPADMELHAGVVVRARYACAGADDRATPPLLRSALLLILLGKLVRCDSEFGARYSTLNSRVTLVEASGSTSPDVTQPDFFEGLFRPSTHNIDKGKHLISVSTLNFCQETIAEPRADQGWP